MSKHYALRSGHIAVAKLLAALVEAPQTMWDLKEITGLNETTLRGYLRNFRRERAIYVAAWERDAAGRMSLRAYMVGRKNDAPKPPPKPSVDRATRSRGDRARARQARMIQMTAGVLA